MFEDCITNSHECDIEVPRVCNENFGTIFDGQSSKKVKLQKMRNKAEFIDQLNKDHINLVQD
jgi:hypothetical protein